MDVLQHFEIGLRVLGLEVYDLAANHAVYSARPPRNFFDDPDPRLSRTMQPCQNLICLSLQRVSRKNCDCFAKNFVAGGATAAQIVVVQSGKIVVDQRIGMQHFKRGAEIINSGRNRTGNHAACLDAQNRAQPLAAGEYAVPHGFVNGTRMLRLRRQHAGQSCIMPALRLAAVMMLRVSLDGQMSAAPALRASVHISSSASRCVHTIPTPGNSLESLCTSEIDARSMSTIATSARCLATLERKSSSDGAM